MSLFGKLYHEITLEQLVDEGGGAGKSNDALMAVYNDMLFKRFLGIAMFHGNKITHIVAGVGAASILVNLPSDDKKYLKENEPFYLMGYHGILPIYVDTGLGRGDILVVCKKGVEKIRIKGLKKNWSCHEQVGFRE